MTIDARTDSRLEILKMLKRERSTIAEMATRLDMTPSAIRQHLAILERDALVAREAMRDGAGRPKYLYLTTEKAEAFFPKRYDLLADLMIAHILEAGGEEKLKATCRAIGSRIFSMHESSLEGRGMKERMRAVASVFKEMGGDTHVEEDSGHFRLTEYNCPFRALSLKYHTICEVCTTILRLSLGEKVRIKRNMQQPHGCIHDITRS